MVMVVVVVVAVVAVAVVVAVTLRAALRKTVAGASNDVVEAKKVLIVVVEETNHVAVCIFGAHFDAFITSGFNRGVKSKLKRCGNTSRKSGFGTSYDC